MSVKVEYHRGAQSDTFITAVYDSLSQSWSVQANLRYVRANARYAGDWDLIKTMARLGFSLRRKKAPTYETLKPVQVGTSGQRSYFRNGNCCAEYWSITHKPGRNSRWGDSLLVWGKVPLGHLMRQMRRLLQEPVERVVERSRPYPLDRLPVSYIRPPIGGKAITDRIQSILDDGLLAWNIRLAVYRMRGQGQPRGDQMSSDNHTGGYRYNFFDVGTYSVFGSSNVAVVPRTPVLRRASMRWNNGDSGSELNGPIHCTDDTATETFRDPVSWVIPQCNTTGVVECLVLGRIPANELVFLTTLPEVAQLCQDVGVECYLGPIRESHEILSLVVLEKTQKE